jgi:hypothetical protein
MRSPWRGTGGGWSRCAGRCGTIKQEVAVLVIHRLDPVEAVPGFWGTPPSGGLSPRLWEALCKERGLVAFAAREDEEVAGFAVAESHSNLVHVLNLEGDARACRLLLDRLVRLAGERAVGGWFPVARTDLREMLEGLGFTRICQDEFRGRPSYLYRRGRRLDR